MRSARHAFTRFVQFNPQTCKACWQCIDECPRGVLGQVSFRRHEHIHVDKPEVCIGYLQDLISRISEYSIELTRT